MASSARCRLVPVPISTLRDWSLEAYAEITEIARGVAVRAIKIAGNIDAKAFIGRCHALCTLLVWARVSSGMNVVRNVWTLFYIFNPRRFVAQETANHFFQLSKYPKSSLFSLQHCTSLVIHLNSDAYVVVTYFAQNVAVEAMESCGKIPLVVIERHIAAAGSQPQRALRTILLRSFDRKCGCLFWYSLF